MGDSSNQMQMQLSQSLITVNRDEWEFSEFTSPHAKVDI